MPSGHSWDNYHLYHRLHAEQRNPSTVTCNVGGYTFEYYAGASLGLMQGTGLSATYDGYRLVWERFNRAPSGCDQKATTTTVAENSAISMYIQSYTKSNGDFHYYGVAWLNGTWASIFDFKYIPVDMWWECNCIHYASSGLEVWSEAANAMHIVEMPMNFIHKVRFILPSGDWKPWEEEALPVDYRNDYSNNPQLLRSFMLTDTPFNVYDNVGGNWTSVSADIP